MEVITAGPASLPDLPGDGEGEGAETSGVLSAIFVCVCGQSSYGGVFFEVPIFVVLKDNQKYNQPPSPPSPPKKSLYVH